MIGKQMWPKGYESRASSHYEDSLSRYEDFHYKDIAGREDGRETVWSL